MAPTAGSDGPEWLAQLAAAEQRQAWAELAQPVALVDAFAFLMRWGDHYSRLPLLLALSDRMERHEWLQLLGSEWSSCDNIGPHRLRLRALLPPAGPVLELMEPAEADAYRALPDRLTVYRGCGAQNLLGACWSMERETAARFPLLHRYRQARPLLVTATVRKAHVLAVKLDRQEAEIITFRARRVSIEPLPVSDSTD
jgi:hypothetical protein